MTTTRLGALINAMAKTGVFLAPTWLVQPTVNPIVIGGAITVSAGVASGLPAPTVSYSLTVGGVPKAWPYIPQAADAAQPYVITPVATVLGVSVNGAPITGLLPAYSLQFPAMDIGQNLPGDGSAGTVRLFSDRAVASSFYAYPYTNAHVADADKDPTTGMPNVAFCTKFAEGALAADASTTGNWMVRYSASAQRTVNFAFGSNSTITSHTFANGVGVILFSNTANGAALGLNFTDGGITSWNVYDPTTYSIWSSGGTPSFWHQQILGTATPWAYVRFMDVSAVNGDFVNAATGVWANDTINWSDRRTPANNNLSQMVGMAAGFPIEWMVDFCNTTGKPGWFCVPELASDDYITQFATYIAQNLAPGLTADFEMANEHWNTGAGFYTYRKAGYMAMLEAVAFQVAATTEWGKPLRGGAYAATFTSDGTTATVTFSGGSGHGLAIGASTYVPTVHSAMPGYSGFNGTGPMTVVDANTVTYPCSQASTGGALAGTTVLQGAGYLALNGAAAVLATGVWANIYNLVEAWHVKRAYQMAKLVKDAFAAVGRQASDCRPVLALQAGGGTEAVYVGGGKFIINYIAATFSGGLLKDRFKAVAVGGYMSLSQSVINSGFGLTGTATTPQTSAAVLAQIKQMADVAYAAYSYGVNMSWVKDQGMELWSYETGLDTVGTNVQNATTQAACTAANADPAIRPIITEWVNAFRAMGFKRIGWYQCGAGTYLQFGCFNLGQTASEITASTPDASRSPKFNGLLDAMQPWSTCPARHVYPCTISGYDVIGNEAVVVASGLWPSLSGVNLPSVGTYPGPSANGQTYFVWLESASAQTVGVTLSGDYTAAGAITISAQPLNGAGVGGGSFALAGVHSATTLGSCSITLQPGPNYVFISASANAANVFPHSISFY